MRHLRIGLDFDGVIANTPALRAAVANELFGKDLPSGCLLNKRYILEKKYLSIEEYAEMEAAIYVENSSWHPKLALMPGAKEGIRHLLNDGHDVCCITSRTPIAVELARIWIERQEIHVPIFSLGGREGKLHAVKKHGREVYIDDDLDYLKPMVGEIPHLFLYTWEYNKDTNPAPEIIRVGSWSDFLERIGSIYFHAT